MSPPTPTPAVAELTDLAERFIAAERWDEAMELYLLALRLEPDNRAVTLGLAEVRKRRSQTLGGQPARPLRSALLEEHRRASIDAAHFVGLAYIFADKGANRRAVECLEIARDRDPGNPSPLKLLGRIHFWRKDYEKAVDFLSRALHLNPFDRETANTLGRAQYELKHFEAALRSSVHAFLLVHEGDREGAERLRRRIRTLRGLLAWGNRELARLFREEQEALDTAFDRVEWKRERYRETEGQIFAELADALPRGLEEGEEGLPEALASASGAARAATAGAPAPRPGGKLDLATRLRHQSLWANLTDDQIFRLTEVTTEDHHDAGSLLFEHRDRGRDLYLLEAGSIAIQRPTHYGTYTLGHIRPGALFGEVNYISLSERSADARASEPSRLLRIDAGRLDTLLEREPDLAVQVFWAFWRGLAEKLRATNDQLREFFTGDPGSENVLALRRGRAAVDEGVTVETDDKIRLFREQGLSRRELTTLATFSKEKRFPSGAFVFQEGDAGDEMYVVLEGRARISKFIPGAGEEALAILGRGDFFGEMSLIDDEPRSADARAHGGPLTALALSQDTVHEILRMDSQAALDFLQLLCRLITHRLREIDEKVIGWRILAGDGGEGGDDTEHRTLTA